jgi:hypothetical protein
MCCLVRGEAEVLTSGGEVLGPGFAPEMFRIRPRRIVSWGIMGNVVPAGPSRSGWEGAASWRIG